MYTASIEAETMNDYQKLLDAIPYLLLEDPSLSVQENKETGQLLIQGVGELHLDIAWKRLRDHYKVQCKLSEVQVSLCEYVSSPVTGIHEDFSREIAGEKHEVGLTLSLNPLDVN